VTGSSACGALTIDYGDGTAITYALNGLPTTQSHTWTSAGTKTIVSTGQGNCVGTIPASVTVSTNPPPTVSVTAPLAGSIYTSGTSLTISASASDAHGIQRVDFYAGGTLIGSDATAPYTQAWNVVYGTTTLLARAYDIYGAFADSTVAVTGQDITSITVAPQSPFVGAAANVTVAGSAGCGAATVNYGDGTVITYALSGLPVTVGHAWSTGGAKTITVTGQGNCAGTLSKSFTVQGTVVQDFNRDGWPDLVWRHRTGGYNALWYMNGPTIVGSASMPQLDDLTWEIRAVGDMNGDGKPDLIWQNTSSGYLVVWLMDGPSLISANWVQVLGGDPREPDLSWKIVGAADMNRDGQLDLVWSHRQTGALRIWHMSGLQEVNSVALATGVADTAWEVAGVADMNGDQYPDLVWRNYSDGTLGMWGMQDTGILSYVWMSPSVSDVNWRIAGVADMNVDGQADLVWQNIVTGDMAVWYMNGTALGAAYYLQGSPNDPTWRIVGIR